MKKIPLEIVIPIFNEGEKVLKLMQLFEANIKSKFKVLFCYDLDDDNIFLLKIHQEVLVQLSRKDLNLEIQNV